MSSNLKAASNGCNLKINIIGCAGAGKTSLVQRLQYGVCGHTQTTIGVEYAQRAMVVDGQNVTVRMWDVAGQDTARQASRSYYQGAVGAFVVVDGSNPMSLEQSLRWKADLDEKTARSQFCQIEKTAPMPVGASSASVEESPDKGGLPFVGTFKKVLPCLLLLNKCDLGVSIGLNRTQLAQLCQKHGFAGYMETSAVTGHNTELAMETLIKLMQEAAEKAALEPPPSPRPGVVTTNPLANRGQTADRPCSANC